MPALAASHLAYWVLTLGQYNHIIKYQKTAHYRKVGALSCLPAGDDTNFDREEQQADMPMVSTI